MKVSTIATVCGINWGQDILWNCLLSHFYLWQRRRYMFLPMSVSLSVSLSVCLSVCVQDYSKTHAWIWMKCCMSTDVATWTNWLTFEPDPDHSQDARTGLLSPISYRLWNFAALPRLPTSCAAMRNFTSGKSHVGPIRIGGAPLEWAVVLKWFYSLSRRNTFVRGKCALLSALLV